MIIIIFASRCWRIVHQYNNCTGDMSLTQYCSFINNDVGKAAGRMLTPPHCEILRTPMNVTHFFVVVGRSICRLLLPPLVCDAMQVRQVLFCRSMSLPDVFLFASHTNALMRFYNRPYFLAMNANITKKKSKLKKKTQRRANTNNKHN